MLVRDVFQVRYGQSDALVTLFKEAQQTWPIMMHQAFRILTDRSGPFFVVVTETEVEDFAAWEQLLIEEFANPDFNDWFSRMMPLVESGRREFYQIEV